MKKLIRYGLLSILIIIFLAVSINMYVILSTRRQIITNFDDLKNIDCIVILGAGVWGDKPSPMLKDRLDKGIELYKDGLAPKIIMSGDHGRKDYDEVNVMKDYAIQNGVPSEDIFMDHAGFSTYDSIYRVKEIFEAQNIIVVTQNYHLYRALYIADKLGLNAFGVNTDDITYSGQIYREIREVLARDKDFIKCIFKPKSKILGEIIPINGNGDVTNDNY